MARRLPSALLLIVLLAACRQPSDRLAGRDTVQLRTIGTTGSRGLLLPSRPLSVKFAVIGDSGRGTPPQREVALRMVEAREQFPFTFVLMLGDNLYEGPASREDYRRKFEEPYRELLDDDVRFHAVLGNHDDPRERFYEPFNMKGERFYWFDPPASIVPRLEPVARFFALDSTTLQEGQLAWLTETLQQSRARWKICFLHNPLYTSGRYRWYAGPYRWALESLFIEHGVHVVFSGHEHFYQRMTPQRGIHYFISGGAGSLRRGEARPAPFVARSFDEDYHFMLVEIAGDELYFQAISRTGLTVDAGVLEQTDASATSRAPATH